MIEPEPLVSPHIDSWLRFWERFRSRLDQGLGELTDRLKAEGLICDQGLELSVPASWIDPAPPSLDEEEAARFSGSSITIQINALLTLNHAIKTWTLGEVPRLTTRGSFIYKGVEHIPTAQLTLPAGVFVKRAQPDEDTDYVQIVLRLEHGRSVSVIATEGGVGVMVTSARSLDLVDALKVLRGERKATERDRYAFETLGGDIGEIGRKHLARRLVRAGLDLKLADVTDPAHRLSTLGSLATAYFNNKALREDDPWDLGNLRVQLIGEFLDKGLEDWFDDLYFSLRRKLKESVTCTLLTPDDLIWAGGDRSNSRFSTRMRQRTVRQSTCLRVEPGTGTFVEAASYVRRVTFNGPGGIAIGHKREPRSVNWSHTGRLCPYDTPQSVDVGVTLSLAGGARVMEFGQIASRCLLVNREGDLPRVTNDEVWVSPWDESDGTVGWISFPDERDNLEQGQDVWAHHGQEGIKRVPATEISHMHACEEDMISPAACLVPHRPHNDALRVVMACSFMRQALPLKLAAPATIATGAEIRLPKELPFIHSELRDGRLALGLDLFVGYLPWYGLNFEDAIVISDLAAEKLTSLHSQVLGPFPLQCSLADQSAALKDLPDDAFDRTRFDEHGLVRQGLHVAFGNPLLVQPIFQWGVAQIEELEWITADKGCEGFVKSTNCFDADEGGAWVRIVIDQERPAELGDKLANRHGHKGVISRVLPSEQMPYVLEGKGSSTCLCGETRAHRHLEMIINPLGVLSRMNLGQLQETFTARAGSFLEGMPERVECFDPSSSGDHRQLEGKVLVGFQYVMKLDHNAVDKLHARSVDPNAYTAFAEQPVGGRRLNGGQRMGEMEVWAIAAHGASGLLQEMLTLKSDNPSARHTLVSAAIDKSLTTYPEVPAAMRTWIAMCRGLGIDLSLMQVLPSGNPHRSKNQPDRLNPGNSLNGHYSYVMDPLAVNRPHLIKSVKISLLDTEQFTSDGEVETSVISGKGLTEPMRFHPKGLASEQIFGPVNSLSCACGRYRRGRLSDADFNPREAAATPTVCEICDTPLLPASARRHRMGHIALARPVPNPYLLFSVPIVVKGKIALGFSKDLTGCQVTLDGILTDSFKVHVRERDWVPNARSLFEVLVESVAAVRGVVEEINASGDFIELEGSNEAIAFDRFCLKSGLDLSNTTREQVEQMFDDLLRKVGINPVDLALDLVGAASMPGATLKRLPVIPPALRPDVEQRNEITITYQHVLHANQHLRDQIEKGEGATDYSKARTTQFLAVARLMCNQLLPPFWRSSDRSGVLPLQRRSISDLLAGKKGLLVGNLLGKRVDFSGRAVIVPDPDLPIDSCRLPFDLALRLYEPLVAASLAGNIQQPAAHRRESLLPNRILAKALAGNDESRRIVSEVLTQLFEDFPVILNRQPTLHRLGILAFNPVLGEDSVIGLSPLVTAGFNADFDGDQMAVYLPLSPPARRDAQQRLKPSMHLWHPADGHYALNLSQDLVLGGYLMGKGPRKAQEFEIENTWVEQTEVRAGKPTGKESGTKLLVDRIEKRSTEAFAKVTAAGISFSCDDIFQIANANNSPATDNIKAALETLPENPLGTIILSGARGSWKQLDYIAGNIFDARVGSNLISGLRLGERFQRAVESRDNLVDTKLGTAEGGMLTKFFVAYSQHLRVEGEDCGTKAGIIVSAISDENGVVVRNQSARLRRRLFGRILAHDCTTLGLKAGAPLATADVDRLSRWLTDTRENVVMVRSPLTCEKSGGYVCRHCFGVPPWTGRGQEFLEVGDLVAAGEQIGIIAAQAAGEPGTQMALRSKHIAAGEERGGDAVEKLRKLFSKAYEKAEMAYEKLEAIDQFFDSQGASVVGVHLEVIVRGWMTMGECQGWIAKLSSPAGDFDALLAKFAIRGETDSIIDLKARTVIGARV